MMDDGVIDQWRSRIEDNPCMLCAAQCGVESSRGVETVPTHHQSQNSIHHHAHLMFQTRVRTQRCLCPIQAPPHSTPLHSTPLHSTPLHSTPLHSTPLHSTTLHSIPLHSNSIHITRLQTRVNSPEKGPLPFSPLLLPPSPSLSSLSPLSANSIPLASAALIIPSMVVIPLPLPDAD